MHKNATNGNDDFDKQILFCYSAIFFFNNNTVEMGNEARIGPNGCWDKRHFFFVT